MKIDKYKKETMEHIQNVHIDKMYEKGNYRTL